MRYVFPTLAVLFVILLVLKLIGAVDWSWWWITSPIYWAIAIAVVLVLHWAEGDKP